MEGKIPGDVLRITLTALQSQREQRLSILRGSGAAARGAGAAAAADKGIAVSGNVQEATLITGDSQVNLYGNVYLGQPTKDHKEALRIYCQVLFNTCHPLPLRGIELRASDPGSGRQHLDLDRIYVDLKTRSMRGRKGQGDGAARDSRIDEGRETSPLSALEAAADNRCLVILGEPGSGKSTFLNHLSLCLAGHRLDPVSGWLKRLPGWLPGSKVKDDVPVFVLLRDFARWLPEEGNEASPQLLWDFIVSRLKAQNLSFAARPLQYALEDGQAVVMLDGLDEIHRQERRTLVRDAVAAFARRYEKSRFLVTCRVLSYQDTDWQLPLENFPAVELAPFDDKMIEGFIEAWYAELVRLGEIPEVDRANDLTQGLKKAVRQPDLWRLAPNPLLLTVMALVNTHKGRLPDARALLYEEIIDILLYRWDQIKAGGEKTMPRLRELLLDAGRTEVDLKRVLWQLAFQAQQEAEGTTGDVLADIKEWQLAEALADLHPGKSRDWAHQIINTIKLRAGLLLERQPGVYTFPHRTFQEYLAGSHLSTQADFAVQASLLLDSGNYWHEVILLAIGRLVYLSGDIDRPLTLVGELCLQEQVGTESAWRKAWLSGEVLNEIGLNRVQDRGLGKDLLDRVRQRLVNLLRAGAMSPKERVTAGDTLARLGDPRFRQDAWYLPVEPLLGFVEIPAGRFLMGSKKQDALASSTEFPQHELELPAYYIARYPVTVAQFQSFVEASGHKPEDPDSLRDLPNHPVRYVRWEEAIAYCDWLTRCLRGWEGTPQPLAKLLREGVPGGKPWRITLPGEAEWEKAARGTDGRIFPWGQEMDTNRANYSGTGIGTTSAVGCFPGGASRPYGVEEMSGNVWEWTRSLWGKEWDKPEFGYPYNPVDGRERLDVLSDIRRVLRGGGFSGSEGSVRCAARYRKYPSAWLSNIGFRVVASPLPLVSEASGL